MPEYETMILRFRDLATAHGKTISTHKYIISRNANDPYTWWAWWNKISEKVPTEAFRFFISKIHKNGRHDVFLFDTGTYKFYKAQITAIDWDNDLAKKASPEPKRTPNYYRDTDYFAWFKIQSIKEIDKHEVVASWSYVKVDELFATHRSIFKDFDGKVIASPEELRYQERTIWFIRQRRVDDPTREILLYDTSRIHPPNFPGKVIGSRSPVLLWLSDLHFSERNHEFALKASYKTQKKTLIDRIEKELKRDQIGALAGVLISGDLTWDGSTDEFQLVGDFISELRSRYSLAQNQVLFCTGNHDICFSSRPWEKGKEIEIAPEQAKRNFVEFYENVFGVQPNDFLCCGRRFVIGAGICVEVVSLNSSLLRQEENVFQGHGFLGEDQLDHIANKMGWNNTGADDPKPFRIAMLHHHLVQVVPREIPQYAHNSSVVYDARALMDWIAQYEIELVIHGHMHNAAFINLGISHPDDASKLHRFTVVSMGSSGVIYQKIGSERINTIGYLWFRRSSVNITINAIHPTQTILGTNRTVKNLKVAYSQHA